ncbi:Hsp20/alpha crystallin family protein [Candidatus Parcubacteria bacterium]|nr:Hsp20/alpha crystallin family protein [Candidatus Parcubacteria bacterium]
MKRSFFERLTGAVRVDEDFALDTKDVKKISLRTDEDKKEWSVEDAEGELTVDVYQTPTDIYIKTMVAGVRPEDLDISITRDMVVIKGKRESERLIRDEDYFHQELYWGSFSRTIMLPQEVSIDESEAVEKHGLLVIKLPKLDKTKQTKLRVKNNS